MQKKKNRVKFSKNILSLLLASTVTMGSVGATAIVANLVVDRKGPTKQPTIENNSEFENNNLVGHEDLVITSWNLDDNDFVILDIGDHDTIKTKDQDTKIKLCNEHDISLGIIISSTAENEADIYNDVEYVKSIVAEYDINLPVYLNIDSIIESDQLNIEMKTKIITNFLKKCTTNGINIGLHGTDTNLCRLRQYFNIKEYDTYLVMDNKTIKYDGKYSIIKDLDGNIKAKSTLIDDHSISESNQSENFVPDSVYIMQTGDNITDIALYYGISVDDLLEFNNLSKENLGPGTKLRIPSLVAETYQTSQGEFRKPATPIRGADISYAQGTNIDWEEMARNFEFIIVRSSLGTLIDERFEENATNCNLYGIPMGIYCFNDFTNINCENTEVFTEKQHEQADFTIELLQNKKVDYPVYLDIEPPNNVDLKSLITEEQVNIMLEIWTNKIKEAGYIPGLYCNQSTFQYLASCVDYELSDKMEVWIAGGDQYTGETISIDLELIKPSSVFDKDYGATIAQSTDSAINGGAGNHRGHLDVNFSTVDYSDEITSDSMAYSIKDFNRKEEPKVVEIVETSTPENHDELLKMMSLTGVGLVALYGGSMIASTIKESTKKGKFER